MAIFPCSAAPHRYPGPQRSAYLSVGRGRATETRKLRLCPTHYDQVAAEAAKHLEVVSETSAFGLACKTCDQERELVIFLTLYDNGKEGLPFAGDYCEGCGRLVLNRLLWDVAQPR